MNIFSLENKRILITGASSGIGRAIAVLCSQQGAQLIISGRNEDKLTETFGLLSGEGHIILPADINNYNELEKLVDRLPFLDGFVSNAGIAQPLLLQFIEKEDVEKMLNTNAVSSIQLTRLLVKEKKLNRNGSIVFTSSINGNKCAYIGSTIYAASKAMLTGFSKALALELSPKGIRVNTVEPGMIETDLIKDSAISAEELEKDRQKYPLKRYGRPEEVAAAVVYLLSDVTKWMTGTQLLIDGGYTLQ
jgi:NAD(P)-dependent dehydrogenase (short-subunit alcohol dehydrogenase family)